MPHRVKNGVVQIKHVTTAGNNRRFAGTLIGDSWVSRAITEPCGGDSCDDFRFFFTCEREELYSAAWDSTWVHQWMGAHRLDHREWTSSVLLELDHPWVASQAETNCVSYFSALAGLWRGVGIKQEYDSLIFTNILSFIPNVQEYILMSKTSDLFRWFEAGVFMNVLEFLKAHQPREGTAVLYINSFTNSQLCCARVGS